MASTPAGAAFAAAAGSTIIDANAARTIAHQRRVTSLGDLTAATAFVETVTGLIALILITVLAALQRRVIRR